MLKQRIQRKPRKRKEKSISQLIKLADRLFSIKVRDLKGFGDITPIAFNEEIIWLNKCFTCGNVYPIKKLHCGHYLSRFYKAARWDFDNCRPQCMMCNLWKRGDPITFRQNLIKEIGEQRVKAVEAKRNEHVKLTREYLENLIQTLQ